MEYCNGRQSLIGSLHAVAPKRFSPSTLAETFWVNQQCVMQLGIIVNVEAPALFYGQLRDFNYSDAAYNRIHLWRFTAQVLSSPHQPYAAHVRDFVIAFRMKRPFAFQNDDIIRIIQIIQLKSKIAGPYRDSDTQFALEHTHFKWGRLILRRPKGGSYRRVPTVDLNAHNIVCTADRSFIPYTVLQSNVFADDMLHLNGGNYHLQGYPFIRSWLPAAGRAYFFYIYWALRVLIDNGVPSHVINDRFVLYLAEWDPSTVWLQYDLVKTENVDWVTTIEKNTCFFQTYRIMVRMIERGIPLAAMYRMCLLNGYEMLNKLF